MLDIPINRVIDIEEVPRYSPGEVCIICTGSQGEPMSALSLMAAHEHKHVKISSDDVVVISAHAIPGNEINVDPHHRLVAPRRRRGAPRRQLAGARVGPRVAGRAEDAHQHRASRSGSSRCTVSTRTWSTTRASRSTSASPKDHVIVCEDGDALTLVRQDDGSTQIEVERRAVPVGLPVRRRHRRRRRPGGAARPAQPRRGGVRRGHRHRRLHHGEIVTGPEIVTRGWVLRARGRGAARGGEGRRCGPRSRTRPTRVPSTSTPSAGTAAGRSASSSTSGPSAGRRSSRSSWRSDRSESTRFSPYTVKSAHLRRAHDALVAGGGGVSVRGCPRPVRGVVRRPGPRRSPAASAARKTTTSRAKAAPVEPGVLARGREAAGRQLAGHRADVLAVVLFVAGAIFALGLWTDLAGPVGSGLADGTGAVLGRARVAVPVACFAFGVLLLWPRKGRDVDPETGEILDDEPPSGPPSASPSARSSSSSPTSASSTWPTVVRRSTVRSTTCAGPAASSAPWSRRRSWPPPASSAPH